MATIAFIGLGNMGRPMARNLVKAGHQVVGYDVVADAAQAVEGVTPAATAADAAAAAEIVLTMLPAGPQVEAAYPAILDAATPGTLLIDSSTIDVATAQRVHGLAAARNLAMLDAPVSGGTAGAEAATLTIMVGGAAADFARAQPILAAMGRNIVHAGPAGMGQAAKICNNLILGISMIAVGEAFALADRLGLERQTLFDISAKSSGQCWSLTSYCPVPGPVPASPANRDYQPGFTAAMMLKDLKLAESAADATAAATPLGRAAAELYQRYCTTGGAAKDFSGIFTMLAQ